MGRRAGEFETGLGYVGKDSARPSKRVVFILQINMTWLMREAHNLNPSLGSQTTLGKCNKMTLGEDNARRGTKKRKQSPGYQRLFTCTPEGGTN